MIPQNPMLNTLRGNKNLRHELLTALAENRLPHSLLLVGESGCGAGYAAGCLAADYLFPLEKNPAQSTAAGQVTEIDEKGELVTGIVREALSVRPVGKMNLINIAQIRTARRECFQSSLSSNGRVILIHKADRMNQNAANALLKVLEEPPQDVMFVLTACSQAAVLPTIRSRCSIYSVSPVDPQECEQALLELDKKLTPQEAAYLTQLFAGRIGSCLRARQPERRAALEKAQTLYGMLAEKQEYRALVLLSSCEKDKPAAMELLQNIIPMCAASLRKPEFMVPGSPVMQPEQAARIICAAEQALQRLSANVSIKLTLTMFAAELC